MTGRGQGRVGLLLPFNSVIGLVELQMLKVSPGDLAL